MFGYAKYVILPPTSADNMKRLICLKGANWNSKSELLFLNEYLQKSRRTNFLLREFQTLYAWLDNITEPLIVLPNYAK